MSDGKVSKRMFSSAANLMSVSELTTNAVWRSATPIEVLEWLSPLSAPWWIAGGWALDLFVGQVTRPHGDIDVGIFRRDAQGTCATLSEWEFFEARAGALTQINIGTAPRAAVNSLWCRRRGEAEWAFELMLDEGGSDQWTFRRDHKIGRPLEIAIRRSPDGIPYLAPEIQLLYKSKAVRSNDQIDFDRVVCRLDRDARAWLRTSIEGMDPSHTWLSKL
jgi:aminoglycoside-2''-adenylyltransferase